MSKAEKIKKSTKKTSNKGLIDGKGKKLSFKFSALQKTLRNKYNQKPLFYWTGVIIILILVVLFSLFWFKKSIFLAGTINGQLVTTPQFYSKLVQSSGEEVFDAIVRETLIKQEAAKKGLEASTDDIDKKLKALEDRLGGKENLDLAISQNNTNLKELKEQISLQILVEKLLEDKVNVTDKEIKEYKAGNKASTVGMSDDEIREIIKSNKLNEEFTVWYQDLKSKAKINSYF